MKRERKRGGVQVNKALKGSVKLMKVREKVTRIEERVMRREIVARQKGREDGKSKVKGTVMTEKKQITGMEESLWEKGIRAKN